MELFTISLLNGLSYGLLLFMLSAGLTLIFSMMGVLNFAHASFYMLGAYIGYSVARVVGFWLALVIAPLTVGLIGAAFERYALRRGRKFGHMPELLMTFGLAIVVLELVQLLWGRAALDFRPPALLRGSLFTVVDSKFPATRGFIMLVALTMLLALWLLLKRTRIGLVIQAALTHPEMAEALGHDVPRVFMWVFGVGAGLAGLAGVVGGSSFVTEPAMAAALGPVIFVVVVVGGLGSIAGAFVASLAIGVAQTLLVGLGGFDNRMSQVAPVLPYLLLVLMLIFRPRGLMGRREG
jgi:branched-chain amino acid transport system permease protein